MKVSPFMLTKAENRPKWAVARCMRLDRQPILEAISRDRSGSGGIGAIGLPRQSRPIPTEPRNVRRRTVRAVVGGIYHRQADAQQAVDGLILAGVEPGAFRFTPIPRSVEDVLAPLGIPHVAIGEYERQARPGDILLTVNTDALPAASVANEIARTGGLVIQLGQASTGDVGVR